ncbi:MAG: S8 family serine peptidase [Roseiflexus sp.]|jgi:phage tail protein X|nr:S8 family serine peptidase [Roseiflexus sp.]MBO9363460.1 S8 family serine peptidase [Roseiflexus sp.]MBO9383391.1 S8 family serine peptidase [Roseiflexus sp.]MBO9387997.1 S8 family serine peptidase [Roseiflexus sp.]
MSLRILLALAIILLAAPSTPNDPSFDRQWALRKVGALCAWDRTTGSANVIVAVVDSGVDPTHPDLVDRLRTDGYDFVDDDSDPRDENGHGTHVAGIVAAVLNNNEGVAGLAPGVTILPVRVMDARGRGSDRAIARGIRFSADKGAKVINLSLGATLTLNADEPSALVNDAIVYAQQQGALVVVAAGNDAVPLPNAIAVDNPDVLVVAATDERDRKAPFSNSGPWVAVSAPGVNILSTMPTYEVFLTSNRLPPDERFRRNYDYMSGTSQATPYVAALAALLFSANPDWSPAQVAEAIRSNATNIRDLNPRFELGTGRIDACKSFGGPPAEAAPQPALPPSTVRGESFLGLLALCICGIVLALVAMTLTFIRGGQRRAPTPVPVPAPVPVYTPPPAPTPPQPYRMLPVAAPQPPTGAWGTLMVIAGAAQPRTYLLAGAEVLIGRSEECQIVLIGDGSVSRRHAIVRNDGRQVTVADAGSSHGTYLNGVRITQPTPVRRGDVLQVGQTQLRFG